MSLVYLKLKNLNTEEEFEIDPYELKHQSEASSEKDDDMGPRVYHYYYGYDPNTDEPFCLSQKEYPYSCYYELVVEEGDFEIVGYDNYLEGRDDVDEKDDFPPDEYYENNKEEYANNGEDEDIF